MSASAIFLQLTSAVERLSPLATQNEPFFGVRQLKIALDSVMIESEPPREDSDTIKQSTGGST
jgi:hypothetical protein